MSFCLSALSALSSLFFFHAKLLLIAQCAERDRKRSVKVLVQLFQVNLYNNNNDTKVLRINFHPLSGANNIITKEEDGVEGKY